MIIVVNENFMEKKSTAPKWNVNLFILHAPLNKLQRFKTHTRTHLNTHAHTINLKQPFHWWSWKTPVSSQSLIYYIQISNQKNSLNALFIWVLFCVFFSVFYLLMYGRTQLLPGQSFVKTYKTIDLMRTLSLLTEHI